MKTIIISDIHNRHAFIEPLLSEISHDKVIFLGDYFDDFHDIHTDIVKTAKWLKSSLSIPNRIHLHGNHDLYYRFYHNPHLMCSGNTEEKAQIINEIITDFSKFHLYYFHQNFLFTHAGVHPEICKNEPFFNDIFNNRKTLEEKILKDAKMAEPNPFTEPGIARGGVQSVGGCTWLDWSKFKPIPNLNQIVGHTPHSYPEEKSTKNSVNHCLDTNNHHIGILENGKLKIIENKYI